MSMSIEFSERDAEGCLIEHGDRSEVERFGRDTQKKLFELFPYGYVKQASKIAGMRRPRAWSTG